MPANRSRILKSRSQLSHAAYWTLLGLALLSGAVYRFSLSQILFLDGDSWGYLNPALSKLTGGEFRHFYARDSFYPGFILALLQWTGDIRAICVAQHLLGLLTGVLMALSWNTLCLLLLDRPAGLWLRLAGLLPVVAYLNSNVSFQYEHSLRPEAIFPFFAMLSLFVNLALIHRRWFDPAPHRVDYSYVAAFVVPVMVYRLKPSFGFSVMFAMLPGLIALAAPGIKWGEKAAIAFVAIVGIASLLIPETLLKQSDPFTKTFLPDTLFNLHADLVLDQLNRDLANHAQTPYPEDFTRAVRDRLTHLLEVSRRPENNPYPSLGFSPDYLIFIDNVFTPLYPPKQRGGERRAEFEMYYYLRTVLHQPGRMLAKVWRQMRLFYRFGIITKPATLGTAADSARNFYQRNVDFLNTPIRSAVSGKLEMCEPGKALKSESVRLAGVDQPIGARPISGVIQALLGLLYLPGLLASAALGAYTIWKRRFVVPTMLVALVYSYNFGNNLTIAIVHSLDADRYVANELALTLFASAAGCLFVATMITRQWRVPSAPPPPSPTAG